MPGNKKYLVGEGQDQVYQDTLNKAGLLEQASGDALITSGRQYGAAAFAQLASTKIDYDILSIDSMQKETQAQQIELQAVEQANLIREQFNQSVGNAVAGAAKRGVKTTEGSIAKNVEDSSANLGKDVQKMDENAQAKARMLRSQGKIDKRIGNARAIGGLMQTANLGMTGYGNYKKGKKIKKESKL